jgi:hypothetical protein
MTSEEYYSDLRAKTVTLAARHPDGCLLVVSLDNRFKNSTAGNTCEVTTESAARLILDRTHREATAEEILAYQEAQEFKRAPSTELEAFRRQFGLMTGKKGDK